MRAAATALLVFLWTVCVTTAPALGDEPEATAPEGPSRPVSLPQVPATLRGGEPVEAYLKALANSMPETWPVHIWVEEIGRSQQGRPIQMVTLATGDLSEPPRASVFVVAAQHGDEPAGTRAVLGLIHDLAQNGNTGRWSIPDGVAVYVVPVANPDGAHAFKRMTANGRNLNRDWCSRALPEARAIARMIEILRPDALIDLHEQTPLCPGGVYVMGTPAPRASGLVNAATALMKKHGLSVPARTARRSSSTKLLHHHFAATYGRPGILVESRYTRKAEADLGTRSAIHKLTVMAVVDALSTRAQGAVSAR